MLSTLNQWSTRCVSTLADLEKQITSIKAESLKRHKEEVEWAAQVEKLTEGKEKDAKDEEKKGVFGGLGRRLGVGAASKRGSGGLGGGNGGVDDMDVDEDDEEEKRDTRSSKKRGFGLGLGK